MPRPPKCRRVEKFPQFTYFKPAGIPVTKLFEIHLTVEELEAIRLRDLEGLEYEECAQKMTVSRPTFYRIITAARRKIAEALVNGSALRVTGGNYSLAKYELACKICGHHWEDIICCRRTRCPVCNANNWDKVNIKKK
ncbi:DUF134 domain-containing protein [Pelotomaculum terephthalicicum JT]|uniref:DUF134 domain-containing protein n=1 Tax=Pelotomaculum TaxID=191373 RepID=UPI0009C7F9B2|nr:MULTISPECIES: DUF134 domain-containing protein [Pelotomaculum]MCG9969244.1 DUF134 domain-containing protein [Pelotomaculum terephthalicicum JT]OPX86056.1 MAG: hypothetical protein A4E54_02106 [Pelotomaculum sp. PtaB.Bin117]OPY61169.1 MAG: hypothetical protein A4E56_02226 [Pelotomaculum sp. PtaU1.Bin065]